MRIQTEFQHLGHYWRKGSELGSTKPSQHSVMYVSGYSISELRRCLFSVLTFRRDNPLAVLSAHSQSLTFQSLSIHSVDKGQSGLWTRPVCLLETSVHSFYNKLILWSSNEASRWMSRWREDKRTKLIWSEIMHYPLAKRINNPWCILRVIFFVYTFTSTSSVSVWDWKQYLSKSLVNYFNFHFHFWSFYNTLQSLHISSNWTFCFDMPPCYQMSRKPTQAIQWTNIPSFASSFKGLL